MCCNLPKKHSKLFFFLCKTKVNATIQKIAAEKGELLQQRADEVDQYERRIRSLTEEVLY